jgi:uncharacterized membrane protein
MIVQQHHDVWTWLHVEYLWFLASPVVVYVTSGPNTLEGAVIPALISVGLLLKFWRQIKDQQIVIGFLLFAVTIGLSTQYWGVTGLHLITGGLVIWPTLVLLLGDRLPWPVTYPLAYIGTIVPDLYGAGMAAGWHEGWFFGVGGAGFLDGDFVFPLETVVAAAAMHWFGNLMRKRGYFISERYDDESEHLPRG